MREGSKIRSVSKASECGSMDVEQSKRAEEKRSISVSPNSDINSYKTMHDERQKKDMRQRVSPALGKRMTSDLVGSKHHDGNKKEKEFTGGSKRCKDGMLNLVSGAWLDERTLQDVVVETEKVNEAGGNAPERLNYGLAEPGVLSRQGYEFHQLELPWFGLAAGSSNPARPN